MRLPRNSKIFRGQLDAAPFASVSFLLVIFLLLQSKLVFNPGVRIDLPQVPFDLPGTDQATAVVAVDRAGQIYYESQATTLSKLREQLRQVVEKSPRPVTLEVRADRSVTLDATMPLLSLASELGMREAVMVTRPRVEPLAASDRK